MNPRAASTTPAPGARRPAGSLGRSLAAAGLVIGLAVAGPGLAREPSSPSGSHAEASRPDGASAAGVLTAWVLETADNQGLPFLIVDKVNARVLAYDRDGLLLGSAPVLLGLTEGDVSPPGIGERPLSAITPAERITPAGRFLASIGENLGGKSILWIDYDTALSLHPVVTTRAADRRLQRLTTDSAEDNRISYGCVNVPARFYEDVVRTAFSGTMGVVYILPEVRSLTEVFFSAGGSAGPDPGAQTILLPVEPT